MAVTQNSYTGNGSTTNYSFTFPYLKSSEVKAQIDATVTTAFTLANATTVQFNIAPDSGAKIKIFRETDDSAMAATFYAGSAIKSEDLNDNFTQNLYTTQEVNARYLSNLGGTMVGDLTMGEDADIVFEGATDNAYETTLTLADPTADRTITLPNVTGTVVTTGDTGTVTSAMITNSTITNDDISSSAEILVSKIKDGTARQLLQTDAAGNTTEWTSNIDIPGTLDVTGATDLDSTLNVDGLSTLSSVDINGGAIDGATIGANSAAAGTFTNGTIATADINGGAIDGTTIGASTASTGAFTTLTTSSNATISGHATATSLQVNQTVSSHLIPHTHANYSLGSTNVRWGNLYVNNLYSNGSTLHNSTTIGQNNTTTLIITSKVGSDIVPTGTRDIGGSSTRWNKVWTTDLDVTNGQLNTLGGMQSGTASVLADSTALAATTTEINAICDGKTVQTTISDTDASYPTSGAVVDYVASQVGAVGGLEVISNEDSFPATQPGSGVVISIADAGGIVVNGSGVSTTARTAGNGSDNVTINGFPSTLYSTTLVDNMGLLVSSTGSSNTYAYHKLLGKESDIKALSDDINDFNARYRIASSAPSSNNDDGDLYFDTSTKKMKVYNATTSAWDDVATSSSSYIVTLSEAFDNSRTDFTMSTAATDAQSTIVSINGVIQKPNAGTSTPSEGFAISGNTLKLSNAPATGSTYFVVVLGDTVSIGTPSDNTVSTAKIQNLAVTGDKIATNLDLADSKKIRFGTGNDLEIYHVADGNSFINDTATAGQFIIQAVNGHDIKHSNGDLAIRTLLDGTTSLYYDGGTAKLETKSWGVDITGDCRATELKLEDNHYLSIGSGNDLRLRHDGTNNIIDAATSKNTHFYYGGAQQFWFGNAEFKGIDNKKIILGTGDDLQIYHDGTKNYLKSAASTNTEIWTDTFYVKSVTGTGEAIIKGSANGGVELYYDNSAKLATTSHGVLISGNTFQADNYVAAFGSADDLQIYHDGSNSYINNSTGNFQITCNEFRLKTVTGSESIIQASQQGNVELYYDHSKKFSTNSSGCSTHGNHYFDDNQKVLIGSGSDLQIYHDGTDTYFKNHTTGNVIHRARVSWNLGINATDGGADDAIKALQNGAVELYYDHSKKLETTSGGITVTGSVTTQDINLSNLNAPTPNEVDSTRGSWTMQEGADDLFLINRSNGKKYKFNLTEVS